MLLDRLHHQDLALTLGNLVQRKHSLVRGQVEGAAHRGGHRRCDGPALHHAARSGGRQRQWVPVRPQDPFLFPLQLRPPPRPAAPLLPSIPHEVAAGGLLVREGLRAAQASLVSLHQVPDSRAAGAALSREGPGLRRRVGHTGGELQLQFHVLAQLVRGDTSQHSSSASGPQPAFPVKFPTCPASVASKFHLPSAPAAEYCPWCSVHGGWCGASDSSHPDILHNPSHSPAPPQPTSKSPVLRAWKATLKVSALPFREKPRLLRGVWQTMESRAACMARRSSSHSCFPGEGRGWGGGDRNSHQ